MNPCFALDNVHHMEFSSKNMIKLYFRAKGKSVELQEHAVSFGFCICSKLIRVKLSFKVGGEILLACEASRSTETFLTKTQSFKASVKETFGGQLEP